MAQCSNCGSPLSDGQKFCGTCGNVVAEQPLASSAAAAVTPAVTPPPVPAQPTAFTPPAYPPQGAPQGYPQGYNPQAAYGPGGAWQAPRKSNKGLWIGLAAAVLVIAIAAVLVFVVFWDDISAGGGGGGGDASAQQMLAAAWASPEATTDASGTYDVSITLNTDTSGSAEDQQLAGLFGGPITISGTFATTQSPVAVDLTVGAMLFGQSIDAGVRLVDGQPWIQFAGQWYDAPPELQQSLADSGMATQAGQIKELLANNAVDPSTWLTDLKEVGDEDVDGVETVHITGSPDLVKMITDVTLLMQSPEGQNLLNIAGSSGAASDMGVEMPTEADLAELQTQLDAMLQNATVDLWLAKEDNSIRKLTIAMSIVPPKEDLSTDSSSSLSGLSELSSMFKSVDVSATVTLAGGQPAAIVAPEGALPFTDLEAALESDAGILGMFLGGGF